MQQGTPFNLMQLTDMPSLPPSITDTASPYTPVPVFFIHSFEQPFCEKADCSCHLHKQEAQQWFVKIIEGHVELEQASTLLDDLHEEGK